MRFTRTCLVSLTTIGALLSPLSLRAAEDDPADAVRMTLSECLTRALENNLDLAIAKKDPESAWNDVLFQKAVFDPGVEAAAGYGESKSEPQSLGTATSSSGIQTYVDFTDRLQFGASYAIRLSPTKTDAASSFALYNPQYDTPLSMGFHLPMLRGFGRESTTRDLILARTTVDISHEELRRQVTDVLRSVEDAYWDLRAAQEAQRVAEQALRLSQDLLGLNRKKVEVGTLAPIEITQAEANEASNVELVIVAKVAVGNAQDALLRLLAVPETDPIWGAQLVPSDEPVSEATAVELSAAIATGLRARPEISSSELQLKNAQLNERVSKRDTWHRFDFDANFTPSGNNLERVDLLGYDPGPDGIPGTTDDVPILDYVTGGVGESIAEIPKLNNYDWSVRLTYAVPLGNRAAKAGYANARIAREKSELGLLNTQEIIRVDVRRAVRSVQSGYERIVAARKNVELQTKKLDAEQKKFDNGMSTSFEVFTFQTDLRNAQLRLIQALLDYNKSLADLERAKGTLLESKGLELADNAGR